MRHLRHFVPVLVLLAVLGTAAAQGQSQYAGATLNVSVESDQYSAAMQALAPDFTKETGIKLNVSILGYSEIYQRAIADFVGHTDQADLYTTDIVWSCEFAQNHYTEDLTSLIKRDAAELKTDDILPVMWTLGSCDNEQIAFPLVGYAGVLAYNKAAFDAAGLQPPTTVKQLVSDAAAFTKNGKYGIVMNGARGSPSAQDYMFYMLMTGGSLLDANGKPQLNSAANVAALKLYASLFQYAPPGAVSYSWGDRVTSFGNGNAMMMMDFSAGLDYLKPGKFPVSGKAAITTPPVTEGMKPVYPFGGWGIAINADSRQKGAAWDYIKWLSRPDIRKRFVELGGQPIRTSTLTDPAMVKAYPYFPVLLKAFQNGNGDFRPRIPEYPQIENAVGLAVNLVINNQETAQAALDAAQTSVEPLFK